MAGAGWSGALRGWRYGLPRLHCRRRGAFWPGDLAYRRVAVQTPWEAQLNFCFSSVLNILFERDGLDGHHAVHRYHRRLHVHFVEWAVVPTPSFSYDAFVLLAHIPAGGRSTISVPIQQITPNKANASQLRDECPQ